MVPGTLDRLQQGKDIRSIRPIMILIYMLLALLATKWVYMVDAHVGMVAFYIMLIPFFFMLKWPNHPAALFLGFSIMLIGKFVYALTTDPLAGPDAYHYFDQVILYSRWSEFYTYAIDHIKTNFLDASAYPIFGLLYMPFYKFLGDAHPLTIITLNSLLLILCCYMTYLLNKTHFRFDMPNREAYYAVLIFGSLASPSFMYMSSIFAKDVACVLLGLYSAYVLLNRRYVLFLVVIIYSTMLRDYSIVYSLGFYCLFSKSFKTALAMMIAAIGILAVKVGIFGLLNAALLTFFLFISPNPMNNSNWDTSIVLRTIEAVFMLFSLLLSVIVYIRHKETRKFYVLCLILLYTYACALVLVGFVSITGKDMEYTVGTIGDNMARKKLPILPIVYMMNAYTIAWLIKLKVRRRLPSEAETCSTDIEKYCG